MNQKDKLTESLVKTLNENSISEEVETVAERLYDDINVELNRDGTIKDYDYINYETYNDYYEDCTESTYNEGVELLNNLMKDIKYYNGYLVLSDNETANNIDDMPQIAEDQVDNFWAVYEGIYDKAIQNLEDEIGISVYGLGRSGKHICVDNTFDNLKNLNNLKEVQSKWEEWLKSEVIKYFKGNTINESKLTESDSKFNVYLLEEFDGEYNSTLIDTVDSEEQAVDRVAELQAETGSSAYYKEVVNGVEIDEDEDSIDAKIASDYNEILELLDAMPDSPFDEIEEDTINDIMLTYPDKTSEEIAEIYKEYCETGAY